MCQYIKDNGEQCGRDTEPYCFQHEDSQQAESGSSMDFVINTTQPMCDNCETALRPTVTDVSEAAYNPKSMVFTLGFKCDCTVIEYGDTKVVAKSEVPEEWK